jgi:hypothetical protein
MCDHLYDFFVELYGDGKYSGKWLYVEIEHFVSSRLHCCPHQNLKLASASVLLIYACDSY